MGSALNDPPLLSEGQVRRMVKARDQGRCRRCNRPATNLHHRVTGGMGGSKTERVQGVAGRVTLCGSGVTGCHGWATAASPEVYAKGWLIRRNGDRLPAEVPLVDMFGATFYLTNEGTVKW